VGQGTGMGLAVVHGIVTSNHGIIKVESELGKGSAFHLFFPITQRKPEEQDPSPESFHKGRERIMVVDDDPAIVSMTERFLSKHGYQVSTCPGGREAFEKFSAEPDSFDLLITDQTMPDLSGLELIEEIHKLRKDLPAILCTGYSTRITPENIERTRIETVMMKPVRLTELTGIIRSILDRK
jgi:CheY-like chemotaxis protein